VHWLVVVVVDLVVASGLVLVGLEPLFWLTNRLMTMSIAIRFQLCSLCVGPINSRRTFARNQARKNIFCCHMQNANDATTAPEWVVGGGWNFI